MSEQDTRHNHHALAVTAPSHLGSHRKLGTPWTHHVRLLLAIALFWMGLYVYVPTLTPYVAKLGGSYALVGLVVAVYGIPQLTMRVWLGSWADRVGRQRPFMSAGFLLVVVSSLGMALVASAIWVAVFRLMAGLAASTWAMFSIAYLELHGSDHHAQAMGWVTFANNAGQVVAALLGGFLVAQFGWLSPFKASVLLALVGLGLVLVQPQTSRHAGRKNSEDRRQLAWLGMMRNPWLIRASLLGALIQAITFVTTYGYVPLLAVYFGLARGDLGVLMACGMIPTILMSVVTGSWLSRRLDSSRLLIIGFVLASGASVLTPLFGRDLIVLFALQAILGGARGVIAPLLMAWSIRDVPVERRTTAMATYQSLYAVGMILGPAVAGTVVTWWGLDASFLMAGGLGVTGTVVAVVVTVQLVHSRISADVHSE